MGDHTLYLKPKAHSLVSKVPPCPGKQKGKENKVSYFKLLYRMQIIQITKSVSFNMVNYV